MSNKKNKASKSAYEPGTLALAFGNNKLMMNLYIGVYAVFSLVGVLNTWLHYAFFITLRTNTDYLTALLKANQVEQVTSIGTDKSLILTSGTPTEANAFDTPIQVASSIGEAFYYTYDNLLFVPLDGVFYLSEIASFLLVTCFVPVVYIIEVMVVRRNSITHGTYKENVRVHYPIYFRIIKGTAVLTFVVTCLMLAIILTM